MQKTTVILGVGGHGWESLSDFIDHTGTKVKMFSQTTDWGGFTGVVGRLLELDNGTLNLVLHGKILPVLPWGDFNKRLCYYLSRQYGSLVGNSFDFRSFHIWELKQEFEIISDFLALDSTIIRHFEIYLENFCKYYEKYSDQLPYSKPICLGNLWNQYLYWQLGSLENWNEYYHQKNILPKNLEFHFTETNRTILSGTNLDSVECEGEDVLDISELPILPDSLKILNSDESELVISTELFDTLKDADLIIFPNGSIANWLPFLNFAEIQSILKSKSQSKQLIWLMNLFHTQNELKIHKYVEYVYSLGIFPIIIGPQNMEIRPDQAVLAKYEEEKKFLNLASHIDVKDLVELNNNQLFELEYNLNETFKYSPSSVKNSIFRILHEG